MPSLRLSWLTRLPTWHDANRYWERLQGMRVQVPMNSVVLGGRNVFSPADAEVWVASPDYTIGLRTDLYTNRSFRDAHPLDDNYDPDLLGWQRLPHPDGQPGDQGDCWRRPGLDRSRSHLRYSDQFARRRSQLYVQ